MGTSVQKLAGAGSAAYRDATETTTHRRDHKQCVDSAQNSSAVTVWGNGNVDAAVTARGELMFGRKRKPTEPSPADQAIEQTVAQQAWFDKFRAESSSTLDDVEAHFLENHIAGVILRTFEER